MKRNLALYPLHQVLTAEAVCHGLYVLWLVDSLGFPAPLVAGLMALADGALMLLEVPTGLFADRHGRRCSLLLGSGLQVAGILLMWQGHGVASLAASFLLIAAGDAFRGGAQEVLLLESAGPAEFPGRLAVGAAVATLSATLLSALGGVLAEAAGFHAAWGLESALAVAGLAVASAMVEPPRLRIPDTEVPATRTCGARRAVALRAVVAGLRSSSWFLVPLVLADRGPAVVAGVLTLQLLAGTAGALLSRRAVGSGFVTLLGLAGLGAALVAPPLFVPGLLLLALADGFLGPRMTRAVGEEADPERRATALSLANAFTMAAKVVALPLAAWWQQVAGPSLAMLGVGGVLIAAAYAGESLGRRRSPVR